MFKRLLEVIAVTAMDLAAVREFPSLQRLVDLRDRGGWAFLPIHDDNVLILLTGVRVWPDGSSDAFAIRDAADARAYRCNPVGGVVWLLEGDTTEVLDGVLGLPNPSDPRAPRLVIGTAPRLWTP